MSLSKLQELVMGGEACCLQSMGSQRVGHNWATELNYTYFHIHFSMYPGPRLQEIVPPCLTFWSMTNCFLIRLHHFTITLAGFGGSNFFTCSPAFVTLSSFNFSHFHGCKVALQSIMFSSLYTLAPLFIYSCCSLSTTVPLSPTQSPVVELNPYSSLKA